MGSSFLLLMEVGVTRYTVLHAEEDIERYGLRFSDSCLRELVAFVLSVS